jgi:hypothetical protein
MCSCGELTRNRKPGKKRSADYADYADYLVLETCLARVSGELVSYLAGELIKQMSLQADWFGF